MKRLAALAVLAAATAQAPPDPVGWVTNRDIRLLRLDSSYGYWDVCVWVRIGRYGPEFPYWTLWRAPVGGTWTADEAIRQSRLDATLAVRSLLSYPIATAEWRERDFVVSWCWGPERLAEMRAFRCGAPERIG